MFRGKNEETTQGNGDGCGRDADVERNIRESPLLEWHPCLCLGRRLYKCIAYIDRLYTFSGLQLKKDGSM